MRKVLCLILIVLMSSLLVGCSVGSRKVYKDYPRFGVTFETDTHSLQSYQSKISVLTRGDASNIKFLTSTNKNILKLANDLRAEAENRNINPIDFVVSFVQSLGYRSDDTVGYKEYPKYPEETIFEGNGDCEDTSYVMYSLLEAIGYDVALIIVPNHMLIGIACEEKENGLCGKSWLDYNGKRYYPIETTGEGFRIGVFPNGLHAMASILKSSDTQDFRALVCENKETKEIKNETIFVKESYTVQVPCEYHVTSVNVDKIMSGLIAIWKYGPEYAKLSFTLTNTDDITCSYLVNLYANKNSILNELVPLSPNEDKSFEEIYDSEEGEVIDAKVKIVAESKDEERERLVPKTETTVVTHKIKWCH